jgi:dTDP-4-amino-4,6-dideoxygalactose transaminase
MNAHPQATSLFDAVPQLDLAAQYAAIGAEIRTAVERVLASQQFILGSEGAAFEQEIAQLCGVGHGVGSHQQTLLILATRLRLAGGRRGGDSRRSRSSQPVARSARSEQNQFLRTFGRTLTTLILRPRAPRDQQNKAIIAVHLYGLACDMDPIENFARAHNLRVIEDNAQSIGAGYKGRRTGSLGDAACMSFYPTKNLGAYGDAGMVATNSNEAAARLRTLRNHGQSAKYVSSEPGWNSRLTKSRPPFCE